MAVLEAPPGAGKTTRVPIALMDAEWFQEGQNRIIMLEPRRIAARMAARYMASLLGERVGETVGYRMRGETRTSPRTRIEIVTEGVLARMRSSDPLLVGIGAVVFDEFHERSLQGDLALALALETQEILRPELRVVVMSATLDGDSVARLLSDSQGPAPVVRSKGRQHPVDTSWFPPRREERITATAARAIREVLPSTEGDILVFLPGASEQRQTLAALGDTLPSHVDVRLLHGSQSVDEQQRTIAASPPGRRKVVLATSVAETSVTIEGVRTVIDAGLSRLPRYSVRTGTTHLETVRVSRASADQRRGRAGRIAPGWCVRLWDAHEDTLLVPDTRPEILDADLSYLALELAENGVRDPKELRWLNEPPEGAFTTARELLVGLDALDDVGEITPHGRRMLKLAVEPRLANMMLRSTATVAGNVSDTLPVSFDGISPGSPGHALAVTGALIAALSAERDVIGAPRHEVPSDIRLRIEAVAGDHRSVEGFPVLRDVSRRVSRAARDLLRQLRDDMRQTSHSSGIVPAEGSLLEGALKGASEAGMLVALAWPDRVAMRREGTGQMGRYLMRNGLGAQLPRHDALAAERFLAIAAVEGNAADARVTLAAPLSEESLRLLFRRQIGVNEYLEWDEGSRAVRAWKREELGALLLSEHRAKPTDPSAVMALMRNVLLSTDVSEWPISPGARKTRSRLAFLHAHDSSWPDVSDAALVESAGNWIDEKLTGIDSWSALGGIDWNEVMLSRLDWRERQEMNRLAPTHLTVPSGSRMPVDYGDPHAPVLAVRLQEVFGWKESPRILDGKVQLTLHLLSPAQRPLQVTRDLEGFWKGAYSQVRSEMRGRYPRHVWPEDPLKEPATRKAKPRKK